MAGLTLSPQETSIFKIVQAVIQLFQGRSNAVGTITLRTGETTTTVTKANSPGAVNISTESKIDLMPQTAHAAAIVTSVYIQASDVGQGSFVISHPSSANTDLNFSWSAKG